MTEQQNEPLTVPPKVYQQLDALRESGAVNMLTEVTTGLEKMGFDEALEWVENNHETYIEHAMDGGFEPVPPHHPHDDEEPAEMSDATLWEAYQHAKSQGPQWRLDDLQLEIAERWEAECEEQLEL